MTTDRKAGDEGKKRTTDAEGPPYGSRGNLFGHTQPSFIDENTAKD